MTTTATVLTSIATAGRAGVIGYRTSVEGDDILNVLRWTTSQGRRPESILPESIQHELAFEGHRPRQWCAPSPVDTGFTWHLGLSPRPVPDVPSCAEIAIVSTRARSSDHAPTTIGIDKVVAHECWLRDGLSAVAELGSSTDMVSTCSTAPNVARSDRICDQGRVDVERCSAAPECSATSPPARRGRLHARPPSSVSYAAAQRHHGHVGVGRDSASGVVDDCTDWSGPALPGALARLGDAALVAREAADADEDSSADTGLGHTAAAAGTGSMTSAEVMVPFRRLHGTDPSRSVGPARVSRG